MTAPLYQLARERVEGDRLRHIGDDDLVRVVLEKDITLAAPISTLAWSSPHELATLLGISRAKAARLAAVFELGRRGAWNQPRRGDRCLDPRTVYELMRDVAHEHQEEYRSVITMDLCPRIFWSLKMSPPSITQWLANVCRRSWNRMYGRSFPWRTDFGNFPASSTRWNVS